MAKAVKKIAVTGGAGQIAYSLLFRIANGEIYGKDQPIELRLLEIPEVLKSLEGVVMELEDCAFPLLKKIYFSSNPYDVFEDVHLALLVGAKPRGPGMERKDLLFDNAKIFIEQGKALNEKAASDVIVHVVGNPCNTNALIAMNHAPKKNRHRFFAMTRLDQNRAVAMLAKKAQVPVEDVKQMAVWGNHSATQVPDYVHAKIQGKPAHDVIRDEQWLEREFIPKVQKRGAEVIAARGKSSAASAANATIDSVRALLVPTPPHEWFSVSIYSAGNPYGIDGDLFFSFPCRSKGNGEVEIVSGLTWDASLKEKIALTQKELQEEREMIRGKMK